MSFTAPVKIEIKSDNNILKLVKTIPKSKTNVDTLYVYEFILSEYKLGMITTFTEQQLKSQLKNFFKII